MLITHSGDELQPGWSQVLRPIFSPGAEHQGGPEASEKAEASRCGTRDSGTLRDADGGFVSQPSGFSEAPGVWAEGKEKHPKRPNWSQGRSSSSLFGMFFGISLVAECTRRDQVADIVNPDAHKNFPQPAI